MDLKIHWRFKTKANRRVFLGMFLETFSALTRAGSCLIWSKKKQQQKLVWCRSATVKWSGPLNVGSLKLVVVKGTSLPSRNVYTTRGVGYR